MRKLRAAGRKALLPGWTHRQRVASVAANADAIDNMVGLRRPARRARCNASAQERAAGIEPRGRCATGAGRLVASIGGVARDRDR